MSYDLYVAKPHGDVPTQLRLLACEKDGANASKKFVELVHDKRQYDQYLRRVLPQFSSLPLTPTDPDLSLLPSGSWFLQFTFTLAKPWMSKDDDPFYVSASVNPLRKDKVFKVPFMAAASWKGLLRWTLMHIRLAQKKDSLSLERFAAERFVQTLLFGDGQGEEPGQAKGFARYLDDLNPQARAEYENLLRQYYNVKSDDPLPHHSGRLYFYPTFFDQIDVEVINPHSRETRAGKQPIYLECVPQGAKGTFSLLYVPFDCINQDEDKTRQQALEDLQRVAEGLHAMFLTYGFSAKRTSGYGVAKDIVKSGRLISKLPGVTFSQGNAPQIQKPDDGFIKYLDEAGRVKPVFQGSSESGLMSNKEYKQSGGQHGGGSLSEFKRFRAWYAEHGANWQAGLQNKAAPATYPESSFESLSELLALCQNATIDGGAA